MAVYYARAGGGNWTAAATWSLTSGGGATGSTPTAADDCILDSASGAVTVDTGAVCRSIDCTSGTGSYAGTLSHTAAVNFAIGDSGAGAGNVALKFSAGMTYARGAGSFFTFVNTNATPQTITTAGKDLAIINIDGTGATGTVKFLDSVSMAGANALLTLTRGTLDTNSQTLSITAFTSNNNNTRTLTMGSSAIAINGTGTPWNTSTSTLLTVTANTAVVTFTSSASFNGGGVNWNGMSLVQTAGGSLTGTNSATTVTLANYTNNGTAVTTNALSINVPYTITGTMTFNANSDVNRIAISSGAVGTSRLVTANAVVIANTVEFKDITGAGAATWTVAGTGATYIGDAGGNTNITPTPAVTQTHDGTTSNWATAARWTSRVPLPQDNVLIPSGTGTITMGMPCLGADVTLTGFSGTLAFASASYAVYGSWTNSATMSMTGAGATAWSGRGNHTITSAGKSFGQQFLQNGFGGTYTLLDAFTTTSTSALQVSNGTFDANDFNVTSQTFSIAGTLTRSVLMGNGTWTSTSTGAITVWGAATTTNLTFNAEGSTIVIAGASPLQKAFGGGGLIYNNVTYNVANSPGALLMSGSNAFNALTIGSGRRLIETIGTTNSVNAWSVNGTNNGFVYLPGVITHYISTPDSVAVSITGDMEIIARIAPDDWTPSASGSIVSKWAASGNFSYVFRLDAAGTLSFFWTSNGSTSLSSTSTIATGFTDGTTHWVRATMDVNNGAAGRDVKFYTSDDVTNDPTAVSWTQLGTTVTSATATSIFDSNAVLEIGTQSSGAAVPFAVKVYRVKVLNGLAGTSVFDADFTTKAFGANSFTESSSNAATVSINGTVAQDGDGRVSIVSTASGTPASLYKSYLGSLGNVWHFIGTGVTFPAGYVNFSGAANSIVSQPTTQLMTGDLDLRAYIEPTDWTPAGARTILGQDNGSTNRVFSFYIVQTSGLLNFSYSSNGTTVTSVPSTAATGYTDGTAHWVRVTFDADNGASGTTTIFYTSEDGTNWTQLGSAVVTAGAVTLFSSTRQYEIGSTAGVSNLFAGKIYKVEARSSIGGTLVLNADFTQSNAILSSNYMSIQDSTASGKGTWYAGMQSVNVSGNNGWIFTGAVYPKRIATTTRSTISTRRQITSTRLANTTRVSS